MSEVSGTRGLTPEVHIHQFMMGCQMKVIFTSSYVMGCQMKVIFTSSCDGLSDEGHIHKFICDGLSDEGHIHQFICDGLSDMTILSLIIAQYMLISCQYDLSLSVSVSLFCCV